MSTAKGIAVAILVAIVGLAIVVGGYFGGWWLKTDINNRQAHLNRTTFEQQTTYRDEMIRKIGEVKLVDVQIAEVPDAGPQLRAQRAALVAIVCRDNTHINGGLDESTTVFVNEECK